MIYDMLAPYYDIINGGFDYKRWAEFAHDAAKKYMNTTPELALDLGCGTGKMTFELARLGYDMTGVDYSPEMLGIAMENGEKQGFGDKILWLCQDMTEFELYGTVDLTVCTLDGINHITSNNRLDKCFSLVHNYLIPGGLFVFDINGKGKFENVYADKSYIYECGEDMCIWQNFYNSKSKLCDFYISLFCKDEAGKYERCDEIQREKMYTIRSIRSALVKNKFEFIGAFSDFAYSPAKDTDERIYIIAKCLK